MIACGEKVTRATRICFTRQTKVKTERESRYMAWVTSSGPLPSHALFVSPFPGAE